MKIAIAYTAVCNGGITTDAASRFVATYHEFPAGYEHDLFVICNGGPLSTDQSILFSGLNAKMFPRSNEGWDIGGYIEAARGPCFDYDMMLCLGETVYFHRAGWLKRLADAFEKYGPGFFGPFSSNAVRAHLNTTAFFCPPSLLRVYPKRVSSRGDRYEFEHGENACWRRAAGRGIPVRLVTWDGEWDHRMWRFPNNILWRGDQSNCLMLCNHADAWAATTPLNKHQMSAMCDRPFQ